MTPSIFDEFQCNQGWSDRTLLVLVGRYLNETAQLGAFEAFLDDVVDDEGDEEENDD